LLFSEGVEIIVRKISLKIPAVTTQLLNMAQGLVIVGWLWSLDRIVWLQSGSLNPVIAYPISEFDYQLPLSPRGSLGQMSRTRSSEIHVHLQK
jgi:hypothetical protein